MVRRDRLVHVATRLAVLFVAVAFGPSMAGCRPIVPLGAPDGDVRGAGWISFSLPHVRLETDVHPSRASAVAWVLEDTALALTDTFPPCVVTRPIPPVEVMLFARREDRPDTGSARAAGHYLRARSELLAVSPRIVAAWDDERSISQLLAHEMAHHYVAHCYPTAPTWLHEGLASFYETIDVQTGETVVGRPPFRPSRLERGARLVGAAVITSVRPGLVPRPSWLIDARPADFYRWDEDAQVQANYAGAWAFVHHGLLGPHRPARHRFRTFLRELTRAETDPRVALRHIAPDAEALRALDATVGGYFAAGRFLERTLFRPAPSVGDPRWDVLEPATHHEHVGEVLLAASPPAIDRARVYLAEVGSPRSLLLLATISEGEERLSLLARARELAPDSLDLLGLEARLAIAAPQTEATGALLARLSARGDLRASEHVAIARLRLARGETEAALTAALAAVADAPTLWEAQLVLGLARRAAGDEVHAVAPLRRALFMHGPDRTPELAEIERWLVGHAAPAAPPDAPPAPAAYGD